MKKILIIGTSPRRQGNSNRLAQEFERGAKDAGNEVETVYLYDKNIGFCKGCLACTKIGKCVINDDANAITEKIKNSDVIVWATPVYYYCMAGQMKTMIDRSNSLFGTENKFKEVYLLATAADTNPSSVDGTIVGVQGWIACHNNVTLKGVVKGLGVNDLGDIQGKQSLVEAYEMGKAV